MKRTLSVALFADANIVERPPAKASRARPLRPRNPKMDAIVKRVHSDDTFSFESVCATINSAMKKVKAE